jgi:hypothetical protein
MAASRAPIISPDFFHGISIKGETCMRKLVIAAMAAALAAPGAFAADRHHHEENDRAIDVRARLSGAQEVPAVSTAAAGRFVADIAADEKSIDYRLTFSGLQGTVTQSHIHFAQRNVNGAIVVWLCGTAANPGPAGTQTCPQSGTISGTITAGNVQGTGTQLIAAGELAELIAAIRAGLAYANVHSTATPTGEIRGQLRANEGDD